MAITIDQEPDDFHPVHNPIIYVVSSDNTGEDNFNYVCDIYPTGAANPSFLRIKRPPDPDTDNATFDVHRILEDFVSHDRPDKSLHAFQKNSNSYISYVCKFGEEYGPSSGIVAYADLEVDSTKYAWNGILDFGDFQGYDQAPYILLAGSPKDFLTDRPTSGIVRSGEDAWLDMISRTSGTIDYMQIETYDSAGASLGIWKVDNAEKAFPTEAGRFLRFDAGPGNLNDITGVFQQGSAPIIGATAVKYYLQAFNASGLPVSNPHWFTIDDECTKHNVYRLHFLNEKGGFDSFSFIRLSRRRVDMQRKIYKKNIGSESGGTWSYNKSDRSDKDFDVRMKDKIVVNSEWVSPADMDWLEQLVSSPEVYYDDGTTMWAINVKTAVWEEHKRENDPIANLILEWEYSYDRKRQRG